MTKRLSTMEVRIADLAVSSLYALWKVKLAQDVVSRAGQEKVSCRRLNNGSRMLATTFLSPNPRFSLSLAQAGRAPFSQPCRFLDSRSDPVACRPQALDA